MAYEINGLSAKLGFVYFYHKAGGVIVDTGFYWSNCIFPRGIELNKGVRHLANSVW